MPANIPAEVLQQQANAQAPGTTLGPQAKPNNLTNGRKQPGVKQKTPAQKVYPKLATQDGE
ncbi:MAG: hypothetical protein ACREJM_15960 [Candidatus Saccharimonadales bacterium]